MWMLVAALALPAAGWAADGWDLFGPGQLGASRAQIAAQVELQCEPERDAVVVCRPAPGAPKVFAGLPFQRVELVFRADRLDKVAGRLHESQFGALERFVTQRNGAGRDCSTQFRAGMGAVELVNRILLWQGPESALVIEQFQGKIDRSAFSYGSAAAMADLVREKTAYPPGSRQDL